MSVTDEKSWGWNEICPSGHVYDPRKGPCAKCLKKKGG